MERKTHQLALFQLFCRRREVTLSGFPSRGRPLFPPPTCVMVKKQILCQRLLQGRSQISTSGCQADRVSVSSPPNTKPFFSERESAAASLIVGVSHTAEATKWNWKWFDCCRSVVSNKEVCLSAVKCALAAKPIKGPFSRLAQHRTPTCGACTQTHKRSITGSHMDEVVCSVG